MHHEQGVLNEKCSFPFVAAVSGWDNGHITDKQEMRYVVALVRGRLESVGAGEHWDHEQVVHTIRDLKLHRRLNQHVHPDIRMSVMWVAVKWGL